MWLSSVLILKRHADEITLIRSMRKKDEKMSSLHNFSDDFRTLAKDRFQFLESTGFHRDSSLESSSPTGATVVYLGKHVAFVFSLIFATNVWMLK
jgi:hypothetical protein